MNVREAAEPDHAAIRAVLAAAFRGTDEAELVDELRRSGDARIELVAEEGGGVVGHIMFSSIDGPLRALALAPVAVLPDRQRQGIGSALIGAGHRTARAGGWEAIFVLGDPAYYARFGYSVRAAASFDCAYAGPHFMLLPLSDPLPVNGGALRYPAPFAALG